MSLKQVVLLPHPPIALPEVAGPRFNEVKTTAIGMEKLAKDILTNEPELIVIITPHSSMHPRFFATYSDEIINGTFAMFGAPEVNIKIHNDLDFIQKIVETREEEGKQDIVKIKTGTLLDHGSGVPLYYILKAGYKGNIVVFNYCYGDNDYHQDFGKSIAKAAEATDKKIVLVASGDLSHRIIPSAPAGFHPDGKKFDELVVEAIKNGNYDEITNINATLRNNAGECAYNSLMVAFGAIGNTRNNKVYSYEAPFGVGYLVASL